MKKARLYAGPSFKYLHLLMGHADQLYMATDFFSIAFICSRRERG